MKVLIATTEDFIKRERGQLAADASAGSNVALTFVNGDTFAVNDYIVIGYEGSEKAEICIITAVSAQTITVATLRLPHKSDEPVVKYRYNKRKYYGSLTIDGSYSELTSSGSPLTIQVEDPQGTILEYTGNEGYLYFKSTYYNSTTTDETDVDGADAVAGDETTRYCSIYAIRKQAGLTNNPYLTDGMVEIYRKRAENEINSVIFSRYVIPLENALGVNEVPPIIENVCTLLAAGYFDYQEFGKEGQGVKWLGEARGILKALQDGRQRLIDSTGEEFTTKTLTQGIQSYPSSVDNTDGPIQMFTTRQTF